LLAASATAWIIANPPKIDEFSSVSILGPALTASSYFPGNNTTVKLNETVQWNLQVYNHMGSTQLFLVNITLSNSTIPGPNAASNTPSGGYQLLRIYRAVENNQTWTLPLQWSITNDTSSSGTTTIQTMTINNTPVSGIGLPAIGGTDFRIVIELWSYDLQTHGYVFSFMSNGAQTSVFNQVWFNAG